MKSLTKFAVIFTIGMLCFVNTAQAVPVLNVDLFTGDLSITFDPGTQVSSLGITDVGGGNSLVPLSLTSATVIGMGAAAQVNSTSSYQELRSMGAVTLSGTIALPNTSVDPAIILGYDSLANLNADGQLPPASRSYIDFNALPGVGGDSQVVYIIPEPSTILMICISLVTLGFVIRRRRK